MTYRKRSDVKEHPSCCSEQIILDEIRDFMRIRFTGTVRLALDFHQGGIRHVRKVTEENLKVK